MGNKVSTEGLQPHPVKKGLPFRLSRQPSAGSSAEIPTKADAAAAQQQITKPVEALLDAINLGIYTDAFLLAGYGNSNAADLAVLSEAELAQVQAISKVPILPHHQSLMLAASKQLGMTLGTILVLSPVPDAGAATDRPPSAAAAATAADPRQDPLPDAAAHSDQTVATQTGAGCVQRSTATKLGIHPQQARTYEGDQDQQQQGSDHHACFPCPLMNPFLCGSPGSGAAAAAAGQVGAAAPTVTAATASPALGAGAAATAAREATAPVAASGSPVAGATAGCCSSALHTLLGPAGRGPTTTTTAAAAAAGSAVLRTTGGRADNSRDSSKGQHATGASVLASEAGKSNVSSYGTARSASSGSLHSNGGAEGSRPLSSSNGNEQSQGTAALNRLAAANIGALAATAAGAVAGAGGSGGASAEVLRPTSSYSSRSQRAADAAAAAASALTQAAMHLGRVTLSERSPVRLQQPVVHQQPSAGPQEAAAGNPSIAPAAHAQSVLQGLLESKPAELTVGINLMPAAQQQVQVDSRLHNLADAQRSAGHVLPAGATVLPAGSTDATTGHKADAAGAAASNIDTAAAGLGPAAATAKKGTAAGEGCWFQDLDDDPDWDDANPFLVDVLPAYPYRSTGVTADGCADVGVADVGCTAQDAVPFAVSAAAAVSAGSTQLRYRAAVAAAAGAGPVNQEGPLTSRRSQLLRPSSRGVLGGRMHGQLSSPAVTAAAAAKLTRRGRQGSGPWEKLPGELASMSYAATASLKTNPLPALAAVASGQPWKQHAVEAEPGVLTLNACQLPLRAVSESDFSVRSGYGRHPGLRAEESAASAAVALQQLARQQATNQQLIQRLLHVPPAGSGPVAGHDTGAGQDPALQGQHGYTPSGHSVAPQGPAPQQLLLPEGSAVSAMLAPSTSLLLVQQQPQLFAQYSSSSGNFLAPVSVANFGGDVARPQVLVLAQPGLGAVPATVACAPQHYSEPHTQHAAQHQQWQAGAAAGNRGTLAHMLGGQQAAGSMLQDPRGFLQVPVHQAALQQTGLGPMQPRRSASALGNVSGLEPGPAYYHGAQSCISESVGRASDVSNIVLRAKARAAAKQQLLRQQQQQQVTPTTPVLNSRLLDGSAGGQLKGAAAMLAGNPLPAGAACTGSYVGRAQAHCDQLYASTTVTAGSNRGNSRAVADTFGTPTIPAGGSTAAIRGPVSTASGLAAAVRDGDRVLQLLQQYKELSELDKAVKSRMMQLLHNGVPNSKGASQEQPSATAVDLQPTAHAGSAAPGTAQAAAAPAVSAGPILPVQHVPAAAQGAQEGHAGAPTAYNASTHVSKFFLAEVHPQHKSQGVNAGIGAGALGVSGSAATAHVAAGTSSCAGVLQAQTGHAAEGSVPPVAGHIAAALSPQASSLVIGASGAADVPAQRARASGDQTHTVQASMQHKNSPAKVQHSMQSDQGQKLAGLHRSPGLKSASTGYTSTHTAVGAVPASARQQCADLSTAARAVHVHDTHAAKHTAARQLWQPKHAVSVAALPSKGPGTVPAAVGATVEASGAKDAHPAAHVLSAPGILVAGAQGSKASSVAALVAAVAGRSAKS